MGLYSRAQGLPHGGWSHAIHESTLCFSTISFRGLSQQGAGEEAAPKSMHGGALHETSGQQAPKAQDSKVRVRPRLRV